MITAGQLAPPLAGTTWKGQSIDLASYRGRKVWVAFHRWASCPLCNLRIKEVIARYDDIRAQGIELICVFQSPPDAVAVGVGLQDPPFPVICDPELRLYDVYGVRPRWRAMLYPRVVVRGVQAVLAGLFSIRVNGPLAMVPADFLIDPEGLVWRAYYGEAVSDHVPFEEVSAFGADRCLDMPESVG